MNFLKGAADPRRAAASACASTAASLLPLPGRERALADGAPLTLGIRPEHVEIGEGPFRVTVTGTEMLGAETIVHALTADGEDFAISHRGIGRAQPGDAIPVRLPAAFVHLFDAAGASVAAPADWQSAYLSNWG